MTQRGYPGIHAGMPTAQCLRSASVVNGAPDQKPWRGGLIADLFLWPYPNPTVGAGLLAKAALLPTHFSRLYVDRIVGASLLAKAAV